MPTNASRENLGMSGMEKVVAFDQSESSDDFMPAAEANSAGTPGGEQSSTFGE